MKLHGRATTTWFTRRRIQEAPSTKSNRQLAVELGANEKTIRRWRRRNFVEDVSSAAKRNSRAKFTPEEKEKIIFIAREKKFPLDELWLHLKLEEKLFISRAQLSRYLRAAKLTNATRPKPPKEKSGEFKEYPLGFGHEDIVYLPKLEGRQMKAICIIERKTRYAQVTVVPQKKAQAVADAVGKFNATAPMSLHRLLTDNGSENTYRSLWRKTLKEHPLDKVCRENGIKHKLTRPRTPRTNGMVERFNRTLKNATVDKHIYTSEAEMIADIHRFVDFYNQKPHSRLKGLSPLQAANPNLLRLTG